MARRKSTSTRDSLTRIALRPEQAEHLLQAGLGSAFEIARGSVETLMKRVPGLAGDEARLLHQRATALAVLAARQYREQRLTARREPASRPWRTGLRALVDGPTFESQFSPSWGDNCPPGAIESTTSPAAYLTSLYQWATTVIEPLANTEEGEPIFLAARRPDLAGLLLDNHSLERVEPTLGIVNEILESAARKHLDDHNLTARTVDDALLEARYPFGLPFERYMSQINVILGRKDFSLGDLVRQLDPAFPYFCRSGLHSLRSDDALQMDTTLGPEQRALLLEAAYFPRGARRASSRSVQTRINPRSLLREPLQVLQAAFFMRHYGVQKAEDLLPLSVFCLRTGLDQDGVESLLSIQRHAPVASPNVRGLAAVTPARFGSVYINAASEPSIGVEGSDGEHELIDWSNDHFDRMQRLTRLARWLELSFGDTDRLLDAALQAEHGDAGQGRAISENTLRALGLFRRLRRDFKVSAEDFAALLQGVAVYARGSEIPQFDRVFNDPTLFSAPLVLDNSPFDIIPSTDAEYHRINHLCSALGLDFETYLYLARYILQAWSQEQLFQGGQDEMLRWSHAVVSAFYRLARLPAWLGLSCLEALALLQLMGERGHQYIVQLARPRLAVYQHSDLSDTLGVIQSLADAAQWCHDNDLPVAWLHQHLMPLAPAAAASDRELDLLRQINSRMLPTILSEASFRDAGVPMVAGADIPTPIDWLKQLESFVSAQGLIYELAELPTSEDYEVALKQRLEVIVDNLQLPDAPHVLVRVFQLMMQARSAQQSLVWESLAATFGGSAELNQEVLGWAGGSSYQLLGEVLRLFHGSAELSSIPVGDEVLALFSRLGHRMEIVSQLSLSPLAVRCWWRHRAWFEEAAEDDQGEVSFAQLHLLSRYRFLLAFTRQAEQALLDYLKLVHNLPPDLTEQDLQLIREDAAGKIALFTGLAIRDILETALEITDNGIIATVRQLDHLVRVRQTCQTLQLGTSAALALSRLRGNGSRETYRAAAEAALGSLTEFMDGSMLAEQKELGQSEASWLVVDTQVLVARTSNKARYLLTVKNFLGEPLVGVTVTWETNFSSLDTPSQITDANGQARNELSAGTQLGTAQVIARFGLDRQVLAPQVQIDCDDAGLVIKDLVHAPQEAMAGNLQAIEYRIRVEDTLGNLARDRVVEWSTDLGRFERPQTRTDADGIAIAYLRSLSSGAATVVVELPQNGAQETFDPVTFLEQEYFQYVRFSGPVAATQPTVATARVVNLDGSPQRRVTVLWSADHGGFVEDPAKSITDDYGIATIHYLSPDPGEVTLTVDAIYNNQSLPSLSSEPTRVHELPMMVDMQPAEQYYLVHQARPASFQVRMAPAAAGYPATWLSGEELLATTYTSVDGVTAYQCHFTPAQLGEQSITVRSLREDEQFAFKVRVVTPHTELIPQKADDSTGIEPIDPGEGTFAVEPGLSSQLLIRALRSDGSGDDECRLTFSLGNGADPQALGVVFTPAFGETVNCDEEGNAILTIDCTEAAFLASSDPYNNEFILVVTSNLGVRLELRLRLRYLLDLGKSELVLFSGPALTFEAAALSGRLRRVNDGAPMSLLDSAQRLRLTLEGARAPLEVSLLSYGDDPLWLHAPQFIGDQGELGTSCLFEAMGDLGKRVQFVGSDIHEAQRIIHEATLTLTAVADPGLIEEGARLIGDHGGTYHFTLSLSDADGPLPHLPLLAPTTLVHGVEHRSSGPTDAEGLIHIESDTRNAVPAIGHDLSVWLGHLSVNLDFSVFELVVVQADMEVNSSGVVLAVFEFTRREGRTFVSQDNWSGVARALEGGNGVWGAAKHPQRVRSSSVLLPTPLPGTLQVSLDHPGSNARWLLDKEFPITEGLIRREMP